VVPGDIGDPKVAERVIGEAVARFGRVDTLVNNAGIFRRPKRGGQTTGNPAAFHSGNPSSSRRTLKPCSRSRATASKAKTQ